MIEIFHQPFESANRAHQIEQLLHSKLDDYSQGYECYEIPANKMKWVEISLLSDVIMEAANMCEQQD